MHIVVSRTSRCSSTGNFTSGHVLATRSVSSALATMMVVMWRLHRIAGGVSTVGPWSRCAPRTVSSHTSLGRCRSSELASRRRTRLVAELREPLGGGWRVLAVGAAVCFSVLAVWFGFGFIAVSNRAAERGGGEIAYGLPRAMQILAYAPVALAVLSAVLLLSM